MKDETKSKVQRGETMIPGPHKYTIIIASIVMLTLGLIVPQRSLASTGNQQNVIHQLRIYEIFDSNKKAFMTAFEITPCASWRNTTSR